jgi:hypothetical protein
VTQNPAGRRRRPRAGDDPRRGQRFPIVDPERGLVFGSTMLHYLKSPTQNVMYVSELFKVVGGKIVKIDNIGLTMQGLTTLGFSH